MGLERNLGSKTENTSIEDELSQKMKVASKRLLKRYGGIFGISSELMPIKQLPTDIFVTGMGHNYRNEKDIFLYANRQNPELADFFIVRFQNSSSRLMLPELGRAQIIPSYPVGNSESDTNFRDATLDEIEEVRPIIEDMLEVHGVAIPMGRPSKNQTT